MPGKPDQDFHFVLECGFPESIEMRTKGNSNVIKISQHCEEQISNFFWHYRYEQEERRPEFNS